MIDKTTLLFFSFSVLPVVFGWVGRLLMFSSSGVIAANITEDDAKSERRAATKFSPAAIVIMKPL